MNVKPFAFQEYHRNLILITIDKSNNGGFKTN